MPARLPITALPLLIAFGWAAVGALAVSPSQSEAATRDQAIAQALRADGNRGQVLEVRRVDGGNGGDVFLIKTITDGRVRVHRIPADP